MTSKEDFIKRYNNLRDSIIRDMDEALERAIGNECIDFEKAFDDYKDVYPLMVAVLQKSLYECLEGSGDDSITRQQKKKATTYRNDFRIWINYAGDYRYKR